MQGYHYFSGYFVNITNYEIDTNYSETKKVLDLSDIVQY